MITRFARSYGYHLVVLGRRVPLQVIAAHADFVAHEFVAELERVHPVAGDGAVAHPHHHTPKDGFEFILQIVERAERLCIRYTLADIENGGCQFAGPLRRDPGHLGVQRGEQRSDDAECSEGDVHQVAVALDK